MDGIANELGGMMNDIVRAAGPNSSASLLVDHNGKVSIVMNWRLHNVAMSKSQCFFGDTIEEAHAKALAFASQIVSADDAWAIIGAEAA